MAEKEEYEEYVVGGFAFTTEIEAKAARNDENKIRQIEEKLNYSNCETVAMVYDKAIENHIFETILGDVYLKKLQEHLVNTKAPDSDYTVQPVPVKSGLDFQRKETEPEKVKVRILSGQKTKLKLKYSVMLNFLLALMIVILFIITLKGENANIINYRTVITNHYAKWEQELQEREAAVREKERELSIE